MKEICFETISSTNAYLKENYANLDDFTIVSSKTQTKGRGRSDRIWYSEKNNLLFSLLIKDRNYFNKFKKISIVSAYSILSVLKEYGITNSIVPLINDSQFDFETIKNTITPKTKIAYIQRSKGYVNRPTISCDQMREVADFIKNINKDIIVFVDNCYGEFVEEIEPTDVGADICVGSLIKNPGGGLAPMGGYIVGRADLIERCSFRLTAPGLGKEVGGSLGTLKALFQGLSLAPKVVGEALKNAHFAAAIFEEYGYKASPKAKETHHCIVEAIDLLSPEKVIKFCEAIQAASYVDSYVRPVPAEMPAYSDKVIMASGAFMNGSSIELSADGPLREPYTVYFQGGLTYENGKYALLKALQSVLQIQ